MHLKHPSVELQVLKDLISEWNKIDPGTRKFNKGVISYAFLKFVRPVLSKTYSVNDFVGLTY